TPTHANVDFRANLNVTGHTIARQIHRADDNQYSPTSDTPPNLRIIHVEYAPPGTAWDSEHVLIENQGINDQDMTGWTLSNEKANTYFFPTGFILPGKASVRVWTKSGTDADAELYWGYEGEVWDNQSDTTYLRDNRGTVVDALGWGNVE
ncbi:MAG: lamin tail domain-containing protein, partial [Chloroflexota bacterium]|nr:lamin tail domain-containing protein [Chloroflexota bacterium]